MNITLQNIGKRYQREWVFKSIDLAFDANVRVAITGGNGSGKSTLLQIIGGYVTPSAGIIHWKGTTKKSAAITAENIYQCMAWAAPYVSLYDDMTLRENVQFFLQFKKLRGVHHVQHMAEILKLHAQLDKPLKHYSSGMRQRVKLGLAILADTPLLLLDEPASHLDAENIKWYQQLLEGNSEGRSIFIASNHQTDETMLCTQVVKMEDWKR